MLGSRFGDYQTAFRFGQLACDLVEKRGLERFEHRVYASFGAFATPWMKDVSTSRAFIRRGFDMANASGDLTYAVFGFKNLITNLLVSGEPLDDVQREAEQGLAYARKARFGFAIDWFTGQLMLIRALRGLSLDFDSPDNAGYGDSLYERHLKEDPPLALCTCTYWIHKLQACVLAQDQSAAIEALASATPLLWSTRSFLEAADYHFYGALTRAAACDTARIEERTQHFDALLNHHRQLTVWAENCPATFENRAALVSAEAARLEGRDLDATRFYEEAIRSAREHRFIQNEGLANELAARFYATRDFETIANTYLRNARYCYLRWGADAKVRQLDQLHPHLRGEPAPPRAGSTISTPIEQLDLATVIKVSQAVSGEIVLEKMLDTLMLTALEHAGAERGLLILARAGEQRVAAEVTTAGDRVVVQLRDQAVAAAMLPQSVFHFVLRTQQSVILDDAAAQSPFSSDPYIREHRARSVLCLPLLKQAKLIGVLYLENRLAARVFTPARIAVLNVLASQAAISLENARLYSDLQKENAERRQSEQALRESEDRFARAVAGSYDGVWDIDLVARTVFFSARTRELCGLPPGPEMVPLDGWFEALPLHPEDRPRRTAAVEAHLSGKAPVYEGEFRISSPTASTAGAISTACACAMPAASRCAWPARSATSTPAGARRTRGASPKRATSASWRRRRRVSGTGTSRRTSTTSRRGCSKWRGCRPTLSSRAGPTSRRACRGIRRTWRNGSARCGRCSPSGESRLSTELRVMHPAGTRWVRLDGMCFREAAGKVLRWTGSAIDVTPRKLAEEALRESEERYERAMDSSDVGYWDWIPAVDKVYASPRLLEIYGFAPGTTFNGRDDLVRSIPFHPEDRPSLMRAYADHIAGKTARFNVEVRFIRDGETRWVSLTGMAARDASGAMVRWSGTVT